MAKSTSKDLRGKVIYSIFVRNHTAEGTFAAIEPDLERIKALGTDIILLLPFYPSDGSPFAIKDSRAVSAEYGDWESFKHLANQIHALGMRLVIEIVFNHTSRDSALLSEHPEWFYRDHQGNMANRTLQRSDVFDLDYSNSALWDYQIETLRQWAEYADGFSCNLAPLIPMDFWVLARESLEKTKPGLLWIADTLESWLIIEHRAKGFAAYSDGEVFQVFDMCFSNQIHQVFKAYLKGEIRLSTFTKAIESQDAIYPDNYCKLHFLENYHTQRIKSVVSNNSVLRGWTAFLYIAKGAALIYAGQEISCARAPGLNAKDPVDWAGGPDLSGLTRNLYKIKKNPIISNGAFYITANNRTDTATVRYVMGDKWLEGSFSLKGQSGLADTFVPDGHYLNLLDYSVVNVKNGKYGMDANPVVFCSDYRSIE
ncbi:MAG: alpha-galactosidase [Clostridiales bacterium]|jgi:glycosidase|nr:alpha-galactosidase [Clostridiales bacterium]